MTRINQVTKKCFCSIVKFWTILLLFVFTNAVTAQVYFDNGFEGGSSEWDSNPWIKAPANVSSSTNSREGKKSVRFLPDTHPVDSDHKRSEFKIKKHGDFIWGTEYWIGFSINIKEPVPDNSAIFQHHAKPYKHPNGDTEKSCGGGGTSGVTVLTEVDKNGNNVFTIQSATNDNYVNKVPTSGSASAGAIFTDVSTFKLNKWYDFVIHLKYETDKTGYLEVWLDGIKVLNLHNTVTAYKYSKCGKDFPKRREFYQKIGMYYGAREKGGDLLYDAFRIGKGSSVTYEDVAPRGATLAVESNAFVDSGIEIYPNPTANEINIQFSENQNVENISIYDVLGKEVFTKKIDASESKVILHPNLSKGIYFLKIGSDKGELSKKIIIE